MLHLSLLFSSAMGGTGLAVYLAASDSGRRWISGVWSWAKGLFGNKPEVGIDSGRMRIFVGKDENGNWCVEFEKKWDKRGKKEFRGRGGDRRNSKLGTNYRAPSGKGKRAA